MTPPTAEHVTSSAIHTSGAGAVGGGVKRAFDVVVAAVALLGLAPLMILVAIAIKLTMGGPVIFAHRRVGHNGAVFNCLKFRTMVRDSEEFLLRYLSTHPEAAHEWATTRKLRDDPRITALGSILRRSSLDELPQFFNVLRGEMSCVGPRPVVPDELKLYGAGSAEYLRARPGVTGEWQVNGRSDTSYAERVALDCKYVREWSLRNDIIILLKTIPVAIASKGSC